MSESEVVDDMTTDARRFTGMVSGAWWKLRDKLARGEVTRENHRHVVLGQARQLQAVIAERDQLLIDVAEWKQEAEVMAICEERHRQRYEELDKQYSQLSAEYERTVTLCDEFEAERDRLAHELEGARAELDQVSRTQEMPTSWDREYEEITAFQEAQYVPAFDEDILDDQTGEHESGHVTDSIDERSWAPEIVDDAGELKPPRMEAS